MIRLSFFALLAFVAILRGEDRPVLPANLANTVEVAGGQLPPAPTISPLNALKSADAYVRKTFPQFPDLYCSEMQYEGAVSSCFPPTCLWRFRYLLPNNYGVDPKGPFADFGVCLVYIGLDGKLTHTTTPRRNKTRK
jgi:hypothetical protein